MKQKPLIWTTKGNLPISSLQYRHQWNDTPNETTLVEEYLLGEEIVKRNVHVMLKQGILSDTNVGGVN
jgi:hypothetical protein